MASSSSSSKASIAPSPSLQYTIRSRVGSQSFRFQPQSEPSNVIEGVPFPESSLFEYSKYGEFLANVNPANITIIKTENNEILWVFERKNVQAVCFSPLSSYLVSWERLTPENENKDNLIIWDLLTGQPHSKFTQKIFNNETWPPLKWTEDEMLCGRMVQGEIQIFATNKIGHVVRKVKLPDVAVFEWSPSSSPYKMAVFAPEKKSQPAKVQIYKYPEVGAPSASKAFYKAEEARLMWNSLSTAVIVQTSTHMDKSGKSYYGESGLWFVQADGGFTENIILRKAGPIQDVKWSPLGSQFIVTYGFMPPQSTLFDLKAQPILDFGENPRNTIRWSPNGKLVCLGGFGNLQGSMDFWEVEKAVKLGSAEAHCAAVCEWSPDSRHFLAAVVSPRVRVDNGYKIFRYNGSQVFESAISDLYQVEWRPQKSSLFPDRPLSPQKSTPSHAIASSSKSTSAPPTTTTTTTSSSTSIGKYVPPHRKNRVEFVGDKPAATTSSLLRKPGEDQVRKYVLEKSKPDLPPGYYFEDEPKKKREKKKKEPVKEQTTSSSSTTTTTTTTTEVTEKSETGSPNGAAKKKRGRGKGKGKAKEVEKENEEEEVDEVVETKEVEQEKETETTEATAESEEGTTTTTSSSSTTTTTVEGNNNNPQKRISNLRKKVKLIGQLKEKQKNGIALTDAEKARVATEEQLLKEISELSIK